VLLAIFDRRRRAGCRRRRARRARLCDEVLHRGRHLVGNNTPVFFVRDPYKFPDFIRTQKRGPKNNMRSATAMWDFWSLSPKSPHQVTILFSDRDLPKSYRNMNGYGGHTYSFINAANERCWLKFYLKTMRGVAKLTNAEAAAIVGEDRESHQRDLFEAIEHGASASRSCRRRMPRRRPTTPST